MKIKLNPKKIQKSWTNDIANYLWNKNTNQPQNHLDLVFIAQDGSVRAHKFIFESISETVRKTLPYANLGHDDKLFILAPDFSIKCIRQSLELIYAGTVKSLDECQIEELWQFAIRYLKIDIDFICSSSLDPVEEEEDLIRDDDVTGQDFDDSSIHRRTTFDDVSWRREVVSENPEVDLICENDDDDYTSTSSLVSENPGVDVSKPFSASLDQILQDCEEESTFSRSETEIDAKESFVEESIGNDSSTFLNGSPITIIHEEDIELFTQQTSDNSKWFLADHTYSLEGDEEPETQTQPEIQRPLFGKSHKFTGPVIIPFKKSFSQTRKNSPNESKKISAESNQLVKVVWSEEESDPLALTPAAKPTENQKRKRPRIEPKTDGGGKSFGGAEMMAEQVLNVEESNKSLRVSRRRAKKFGKFPTIVAKPQTANKSNLRTCSIDTLDHFPEGSERPTKKTKIQVKLVKKYNKQKDKSSKGKTSKCGTPKKKTPSITCKCSKQNRKQRCKKCLGCLAGKCGDCYRCKNPQFRKPCLNNVCKNPILPNCPCFEPQD